jgi:PAS domain S-box-containing protein
MDVSALLVAEFVLAGMGLVTWSMVRSLDQALAASERLRVRYAELFENSPHGLISLDDSGRIREANGTAVTLLHLERSSLPGTNLAAALTAAGATGQVDFTRESSTTPIEVVLARPGVPERHLEIVRQRSGGGDYQSILAVTDVTAHRRTERIMRESEERFRTLIESVPNIAVQGYDRSRRVIFWNTASTRLYGYPREEAIGRQLEDLIIPTPMREGVIAAVEAWIHQGVPIPAGELTLRRSDDRPIRVFSSHVMQINPRGEPEMYCLDVDLSEREQAAAVLRESEERFRLLFNRSEDAITVFTLQADGSPDRFIEVNDVACTRLGYTRDELLRLPPASLEPAAIAQTSAGRLAQLRSAGRLVSETEHVTKDGRPFSVEVSAHLFEFKGRPTVLAIARDTSARKALEQQLRQAQKMEVVGRLAGGVAHDFNNILTAMLLNLELMAQSAPDPGTRSHLGELESMAKRAARLTQQLLLFARRQALQTSRIEVNSSLGQLLKMLRRILGEHITTVTQFTSAPLWLEADSGLLDQAVMNLCLNARDAMSAGGTLTLSTRLVSFAAPIPATKPEARPGRFACISVADTGCGMQPEVVQHLFEPFFSTKEVGQGTGLGLASVHGIVHQHHGWIETETTVGEGSTFLIYLPLVETEATPPALPATVEARPGPGRETILLVEDEEVVRKVTRAMLETLGYRVLIAGHGEGALRIWKERSAEIDLLLADIVMPGGISGLNLAEQLRKSQPHLRVLLMSGYNVEMTRSAAFRDSGVAFLAKPFDSRTLAASVRRCFESAATGKRSVDRIVR